MISSEDRLRNASHIAGEAILASYIAGSKPAHNFSPEFEREIDLLIRNIHQAKVNPHHFWLRKIASIILAIALASSIWLTFDVDARATIFEWFKVQYENIFHYQFEGSVPPLSERTYELGWLPEGYSFHHRNDMTGSTTVMYVDQDGYILTLSYTTDDGSPGADFFLTNDSEASKTVKIGNAAADLYLTDIPDSSNAIVWENAETKQLFVITSVKDEDALIKMAENVIPVKN